MSGILAEGAKLALKKWQTDTKDRTGAHSTLDLDRTSMRLSNPACYGKAQPDATELARPSFVGTVEAIKDVRQIVVTNTNSRISKLCHGGIIAAHEPDSD